MKNKIKNVIIINDYDYVQGGASKVAIDTANILAEQQNLNIYFFSACHLDSFDIKKNIIRVCTNQQEALKDKNKIRGFFNGLYNIKAKRKLKRLLDELDRNDTIIHIHGWTKALSSSVFDIAFKKKFKVVLTLHDYFLECPNGGYYNYKKNKPCCLKGLTWKCIKCNCDSRNYLFKIYRIIRQFIQNKIVKVDKKITDVITISEFSENVFKKSFNKKISMHRIYNPVNIDYNKNNIDYRNNDYFLYVGRVVKEKGVDVFCKSISELNLKGIVVGDGDLLNSLKQLYPKIKFVGWKNSSEVKQYMENAKALIFPSRWYETMGLTIIEAQSNGLPCIVYKNCAGSEFIEDKKSGFLYERYEELIEILKNFDIDFKNDKKIYEKFSHKEYYKEILNLYNKLLK